VSLFILRFRGFGERGSPWPTAQRARAAVELAQDVPGLQLGVGPLAGSAQPGIGPVGLFLLGGLVPPPGMG
jgi:hypothetical protein